MKYYFTASEKSTIIDYNEMKDYAVKTGLKGTAAIIGFTENQIADIIKRLKIEELCERYDDENLWLYCIGEDNFKYHITKNGLTKANKVPFFTLKLFYYNEIRKTRNLQSDEIHRNKYLAKTNSQDVFLDNKLPRAFKRFQYANKKSEMVIPFRFKEALSDNAPLLVYHAGVETLGRGNLLPLLEFLPAYSRVRKKDCNILVPQAFTDANQEDNCIPYAECTVKLIKMLCEKYPIDKNRIYITGMSMGGFVTWESITNYPKLFAAALPTVGGLFKAEKKDESVFESIKDIPLWIAHSSNDKIVSIDLDDYCYEKLKAIGADVKYTRWDKYGHAMAMKFYRCEKWVEWMFDQHK